MRAYHQMGHNSENLVREFGDGGFAGAIASPLNTSQEKLASFCKEHSSDFEVILDPQLYYPSTERAALRSWSYFPADYETADLSQLSWWRGISEEIARSADAAGASAMCSPAFVPNAFDDDYYAFCVEIAAETARVAGRVDVLQTAVIRLPELSDYSRVMRLASILSGSPKTRVYIVLTSDVEPRRELADSVWLQGALCLVAALANAGMKVVMGFTGPEAPLFSAAGADACATGKFFNLRRFTPGRFDDPTGGGGQLPYWFEEGLMGYLREPDLVRLRSQHSVVISQSSLRNPHAQSILQCMNDAPGKAWLGHSWRQYMWWFSEIAERLRSGTATAPELCRAAESNWLSLEDAGFLTEEARNDGSWVRPWRVALANYRNPW